MSHSSYNSYSICNGHKNCSSQQVLLDPGAFKEPPPPASSPGGDSPELPKAGSEARIFRSFKGSEYLGVVLPL